MSSYSYKIRIIVSFLFMLCFILSKAQIKVKTDNKLSQTNFVFILVDDLGWMDLGVQGSKFYLTPRIDELAKNGVRFTNAYAANPVCSPTRASIMSGKDPAHKSINITDYLGTVIPKNKKLITPLINDHLALNETTIAEAFKESGYATYFVGKWHLGEGEAYWPEHQGFDKNKGGWSMGRPESYFSPYYNPKLKDGPVGEYLPFRLADEAVSFLEEHQSQKAKQPFFLNFAMYNVHTPIQAPQYLIDRFEKRRVELGLSKSGEFEVDKGVKNRVDQSNVTYAAMLWVMDSVVGTIVDKVKAMGQAQNTAVIFFSDNGGLSSPGYGVTSNRPLRGGKGHLYEGGIRVPLIINYPPLTDKVKGGVLDEPVMSYDFYPTMLDLAGLPLKPKQHLQGKSFLPLLNNTRYRKRNLYWHYPHYSPQKGQPASAIRSGDWKLIHFYEEDEYELYNLKEDIGEKNNLADINKRKVRIMGSKLAFYLNEIGASIPIVR